MSTPRTSRTARSPTQIALSPTFVWFGKSTSAQGRSRGISGAEGRLDRSPQLREVVLESGHLEVSCRRTRPPRRRSTRTGWGPAARFMARRNRGSAPSCPRPAIVSFHSARSIGALGTSVRLRCRRLTFDGNVLLRESAPSPSSSTMVRMHFEQRPQLYAPSGFLQQTRSQRRAASEDAIHSIFWKRLASAPS